MQNSDAYLGDTPNKRHVNPANLQNKYIHTNDMIIKK